MKATTTFFILFFCCFIALGQSDTVRVENLQKYIGVLSSNKYEGRGPGTRGDSLTQEFLTKSFALIGLKHIKSPDKKYHQSFKLGLGEYQSAYLKLKDTIVTSDEQNFILDNFYPLYGDEEPLVVKKAGNSVRGDLTMATRIHREQLGINVRDILTNLKRVELQGNRGLIIDNNIVDTVESGTDSLRRAINSFFNRNIRANFFVLQNKGTISPNADSIVIIKKTKINTTSNIIGVIEGDKNKGRYIIIGAHHDHLGKKKKTIYNGADDNASGVAALLEIARIYNLRKQDGEGPDHTLIFVAFAAEEKGLWGAKEFVSRWGRRKRRTTLMVNIDMIGRLKKKDSKYKTVVVGSDNVLDRVFPLSEKNSIYIDDSKSGKDHKRGYYFRADHFPFAEVGIEYITFANKVHHDYHKPTDDINDINFEGIKALTEFAIKVIDDVDKNPF